MNVGNLIRILRNELQATYGVLPQADKIELTAQMTGLYGPFKVMHSWDILDMFRENKVDWTNQVQGVNPAAIAKNTLSYKDRVFAVAEANYMLYGLIQHQAWISGVTPAVTNYFSTLSIATLYRSVVGGLVSLSYALDPESIMYETATGKVAFVDHGWELTLAAPIAGGLITTPPPEAALSSDVLPRNAVFTPTFNVGRLKFEAGINAAGLFILNN
jgi:hypothetical protein